MTGFTDQEDADYRSGNIGHAVDMIFRELKSAPEGDLDPRIVRHLNRLTNHPAVIATLGDRMIPDLPVGHVVTHVSLNDLDQYAADVWTSGDIPTLMPGIGPTIAAAIRDAIREGENDD